MDARRFDALTKALAAIGVSRRRIVASLVGTVAGGLGSAVRSVDATADEGASPGTPRSERDDDQLSRGEIPNLNCPVCGTCQTCQIASATSAGTCGAPCADPCLASALCEAAQGDDAYRQLADALGADGFAPTGEPQALAIEEDGALLVEELSAEYTDGQEAARTATLVFLRKPGGDSEAQAIVSEGQTPRYGLFVAEGGRVERVARDAAPAGDGTSPAPRAVAPEADRCDGCETCDRVCAFPTGCRVLGPQECTSNFVCTFVASSACGDHGPDEICKPFCDIFRCAPCDQACEIRSDDCTFCVDQCPEQVPNSRCVDDRCRCVVGDQVGEACEPPNRCLDGVCRCIVGNAEGEICGPKGSPDYCCDTRRCERCDSGQCLTRCQSHEACCNGECRDDWLECGDTCCPPYEGQGCCNGACVNWQIDRDNCGVCGRRCGDDEICDLGRCRTCDPALCESFADGRCVVGCREDEVCDPERGCLPRSDEPVDASFCPTWLSEADLLALVEGGTSVTSLTSFDGPDDQGNPTVFCLWDVVGNPLPAEPWFDWLVSVQLALKMWGDVSPADWEAGLDSAEASLGCAPAELPDDHTPVCLSDRPEAVDVTVRLDAFRFLWLRLTSSTTGETPDYPKLREAAERVAAFLVAKLAPPQR